jgi:hypothetical protein
MGRAAGAGWRRSSEKESCPAFLPRGDLARRPFRSAPLGAIVQIRQKKIAGCTPTVYARHVDKRIPFRHHSIGSSHRRTRSSGIRLGLFRRTINEIPLSGKSLASFREDQRFDRRQKPKEMISLFWNDLNRAYRWIVYGWREVKLDLPLRCGFNVWKGLYQRLGTRFPEDIERL